jgi:hypothetical protein
MIAAIDTALGFVARLAAIERASFDEGSRAAIHLCAG